MQSNLRRKTRRDGIHRRHGENNDFGEVYVRDWSDFLQGLKEVRHKRNQLSHGDVPFSSDYAQKDDLKFIDDFHELILTQNDPLTILRKEHERHLKEAEKKIKEQKANKEKQKATERQHSKKANQTKEKPIMSKKISRRNMDNNSGGIHRTYLFSRVQINARK